MSDRDRGRPATNSPEAQSVIDAYLNYGRDNGVTDVAAFFAGLDRGIDLPPDAERQFSWTTWGETKPETTIEILARDMGPVFQAISRDLIKLGNTIMASVQSAFATVYNQVVDTYDALQRAEMVPPDCRDKMAGQKWRNPHTGQQWRVAGRPGNRHWIKSGPRRARWWR